MRLHLRLDNSMLNSKCYINLNQLKLWNYKELLCLNCIIIHHLKCNKLLVIDLFCHLLSKDKNCPINYIDFRNLSSNFIHRLSNSKKHLNFKMKHYKWMLNLFDCRLNTILNHNWSKNLRLKCHTVMRSYS